MNKEIKIMEALNNFRKEVDEIFPSETPKLKGKMNDIYDCDIYIFRHSGMGNSKQVITGNKLSIMTATTSYLEQLLRQGVVTEKELKELVKMSINASKGKYDDIYD